ncbi:sigma-70 family RNA polymerase sigma factor [Alteromonas sp. 5E99-2]|uniref:RNA polymerase sigma factor n=1 Tax=Alteromonas sp. 5E99-2 TaxID=2817683 RepID=UPI001A9A0E1A|nr:sigma-70 family RNA polymerase sigma factor [Alteromonas sp. 5E99-2]MBO1255000.1 sigma-70 family RNA polymerase sigma factor [Alteromonas sp. 5E99-2]
MRKASYYSELLQYANKIAFNIDEAEDLLQTALLAAVEAGRCDMSSLVNRKWLLGVIRNQSAFYARSAVRRKKREASFSYLSHFRLEEPISTHNFVSTLPSSLKTTALLVLTGHSKAEIAWLLRVSDPAIRQRIVQIKKRWKKYDGRHVSELNGLKESLAFGRIRQSLLNAPCRDKDTLASHDPDGHLFMMTSQNRSLRQHRVTSNLKEEKSNA